ncbi:MAG: hypothetical protein R2795_25215 [Saprospiraceae bacterium]
MLSNLGSRSVLYGSLFFLLLTAGILKAEGAHPISREMDTELEMLLPGTDGQAVSARAYARNRMEAVIAMLEAKKVRKKKPSKAIQQIEETVQQQLLQQYQTQATVSDLFKNGLYDQSSASAVIALVLQQLDIPYALLVHETDVYLVAYPDDINKTVAIPGVSKRTDNEEAWFQTAYLNLLQSVGMIPESAWHQPPNELFRTHYLGFQGALNIQQLGAFLYYRQAIYAFVKGHWEQCEQWLDRGHSLADWPVYTVLRRALWIQLAQQQSGTTSSQALQYLWDIWQESPGHPWQSVLLQTFTQQASHLPTTNVWPLDSLYLDYLEHFEGYPHAQTQLRELYFLQKATLHAQVGATVQVMDMMDSLYLMCPSDEMVQGVIAGMTVWSLQKERDFQRGLERINFYENRYRFLHRNTQFQDQHLLYQAERVRYYFDQDDFSSGLLYLKEFERVLAIVGLTPRHTSWVTTAYTTASYAYFRQGNYHTALSYAQIALEKAPDDAYLAHRVDLLKRYVR